MQTLSSSKQLLYLSHDQVWAYTWQNERLSAGTSFGTDRAGLAALSGHLAGAGSAADTGPVLLVVDLVEEDFQRQLLPHVGGKAGRNLIERKLNQLYRDTPYRYADVQFRESEGRRDDMVLLSGLTNPADVKQVVLLVEQLKLPLAGIYSLAKLSTPIIAKLAPDQEHVLLVSQQSGGLRHSYFHRGQLKFSRLTPVYDAHGALADVAGETAKTRQFLGNSRLLARDDMLEATVLCTAEQCAILELQCQDESDLIYHFIELGDAAGLLDLPHLGEATHTEQLLLAKLARRPRPSHYQLGREARFHQLWLARAALYGASGVTLVITILCLCYNLVAGISATVKQNNLQAEAADSERRNQALAATLPAVPTAPGNMKAAVQIDTMLARQAPMPGPLWAIVSQALEQVPLVTLNQLDWEVAPPAGANPAGAGGANGAGGNNGAARGPVPSSLFGLPFAPAQRLRIEAEVLLEPNQERQVLNVMNQFAQALASQPHMVVTIAQAPVDVRTDMKLAGTAGSTGPESRPRFILNLVWKP